MNVKGGTKNTVGCARNEGKGSLNVKGGTKNAGEWARNKG
jgi:hypothetical protein